MSPSFDAPSEVTGNAVEFSSSSAAHQEAAKMISQEVSNLRQFPDAMFALPKTVDRLMIFSE